MLTNYTVHFSARTDTGRKRDHNEDALRICEDEGLVLVADGMGGHAAGDVASRLAVETIANFFSDAAHQQPMVWPYQIDRGDNMHLNRLITGIKLANSRIYETSQHEQSRRGMGTTIVAGLFRNADVFLVHVGDSRIYRVRKNQIEQLTEDHSLLNDYIRLKKLSAEDIKNFAHRNVIVRALGIKNTVAVDLHQEQPQIGDTYLFCSDGLSGMVSDDNIASIINNITDIDEAALKLITTANENGGVDNITVALARIEKAH